MIKKILCALLISFVYNIAYANIYISADVAEKVILEHIEEQGRIPALQEYNTQLKASGDSTMSADGLYKVCIAAGWDIEKTEFKDKCDIFVQALVDGSSYTYYEVCGMDKGKSGGTEYCIEDVFYSFFGSSSQVTMLQADGLCKEYARIKYNDNIECSGAVRSGIINPLNDYVKCTSKLKSVYYEFKFDDVAESSDAEILRGVLTGVGKMYNVTLSDPGCSIERIISNTACAIGYKTTDATICANINNSLERFGYTSEIGNVSRAGLTSEKLCRIMGASTVNNKLKTAYGIPNDVFYDSLIQLQGSASLKDGIKQYIENTIKPEQLVSFDCISNTIKIRSIKGKKDNDDVLTCYINGNQIDFVFDDLSEASKLQQQSGKEGMSCIIEGGTFTGKRCVNLNQEQCEKIAKSTLLIEDCPECSSVYWDGNICTLPNAQTANVLKKGLNIAMIVGGMAINVLVTVGTGGVSTAVGGGLLFVETAGSLIELGTEIKMDLAADKFFVESAQCDDKNCAKNIIGKHLQRLSNFYSRLTATEEKAIDKEMARLFMLIPAEELLTLEALVQIDQENGGKKLASVKDNQKGFFDPKSWEPEQIWQAVGTTMQMASLFYQIGSWAFGKSGKTAKTMTEVIDVLDDKADEAMRVMSRNSDEVVDAAVFGTKNSDDVISTLNVIDRSKLSIADQEFYDLWKAYAPKDQSFEAFKAMSGGDIVKMREMTKTMKVWSYDDLVRIEQGDFERLFKTRPDIESYFYANGYDAMIFEFPEARAILDASDARAIAGNVNIQFEKMLDDYAELSENFRKGCGGDPACLEEGAKQLAAMRETMSKTDGFQAYIESGATGNYSTFDSNLARVKRQKEVDLSRLAEYDYTTNKMINDYNSTAQIYETTGDMDALYKANDLYDQVSVRQKMSNNAKNNIIEDVIVGMEKSSPMATVDEVALERANQVKNIINDNPKFQRLKQNYTNLSNSDRVQFAQELSDEILRVNGIKSNYVIPVTGVDYSGTTNLGGLVSYKNDKYKIYMEFDPNKLNSFDDFVNTVTHEIGGHGIEKLNPNVTAVGAQRLDAGRGMISDKFNLYRLEATEQSAYKVGDVTQRIAGY